MAFEFNLVSVVIPCFRQARFLEACLRSLQAQTWPYWEAIVIDDGSPDDTQQVLARMALSEPRLRSVAQRNQGVCAARNTGLALAKGEFVQFLDADDLIETDKLRWQVAALRRYSDASLVYGDALYFDDSDPTRRSYALDLSPNAYNWIQVEATKQVSTLEKSLIRNPFPVCAPLVRRASLESVGAFDVLLTHCEDWELWIRLASSQHKFAYQPHDNTLALIRAHPSSVSNDTTGMNAGAARMWRLSLNYLIDKHLRRLALIGAATPLGRLSQNDVLGALQVFDDADLSFSERQVVALARFFLGTTTGRRLAPIARRLLPWRMAYLLY